MQATDLSQFTPQDALQLPVMALRLLQIQCCGPRCFMCTLVMPTMIRIMDEVNHPEQILDHGWGREHANETLRAGA